MPQHTSEHQDVLAAHPAAGGTTQGVLARQPLRSGAEGWVGEWEWREITDGHAVGQIPKAAWEEDGLCGITHVFNLFNLINHFILLFFLTPGDLI